MKDLNDHHISLIERHLRQELNIEEEANFEKLLVHDVFRKEVAFRKGLQSSIEAFSDDKLNKLLVAESQSMDAALQKNKFKKYAIWIAITLVLSFLTYLIYSRYQKPSQDDIFIAHYEPFPNLIAPTQRSTDTTLKGLELALYAYDNGLYEQAVSVFDTLSSPPSEAIIYHAIACIEIEQYDRAEQMLITLSTDKSAKYRQAAEWYLCLLALKTGDLDKYNSILANIISNLNHKYYQKAIELKQ